MASFDSKGLRQKRRSKVRAPEELRQLSPEDAGSLDVSRLVLAELPIGIALRLSMVLMFRVLRLRFDAGTLSKLNRERMRQKVIELIHDLASDEDDREPDLPQPVPPQQRIQPVARAAPRVQEVATDDLHRELTREELEIFQSRAHDQMKQVFEAALHAEYRQSLTRLFGGPIHVRLDRDHAHSPRVVVRFQEIHECVLPDDRDKMVASNPRALSQDILDEATAHILELWKAANQPEEFAIGKAA